MARATNHGNVYVKKDGEDFSVTKISIFVQTTNLAEMVEHVLILDKVVTHVAALRDSMVLTVKYQWTIVRGTLVTMAVLVYR